MTGFSDESPDTASRLRHDFIPLHGGEVHIERMDAGRDGDASPPTLLILPQWPFGAWHYRRVVPLLARDADVVAVDLPGFGCSPAHPEPLDVRAHAELVEELLAALKVERVIVLARAASTAIAVHAATRMRFEGLILHGPFAHSPEERHRRHQRSWVKVAPRPDGGHLLDAWAKVTDRYPELPPELATACAIAHLMADEGQSRAYRAIWEQDTLALLQDLETPCVAFVGREEVLFAPFVNLPNNVHRVDVRTLPATTDHLCWTDPARFAAIIQHCLAVLSRG